MFTKNILVLSICLLASSALAQNYTRNKPQPNFFIPEGALAGTKPEKVSIPQYRQGVSTAKRISAQSQDIVKNEQPITGVENNALYEEEQQYIEENTDNRVQENSLTDGNSEVESTASDTPNYQQMYQNYLKDLNNIATQGQVEDKKIGEDLKSMNSEERIQIDKQFNQHRNTRKDIMDAIQ